MKKLIWLSVFIGLLCCVEKAQAQPPPANIVINSSTVSGGVPGDCLIVSSSRKVGQQVCSAGAVTTVSGTANEITVTGTTTAVVSVAAAFDISGHTSTAPIKKGTSLPGTCSVGQFFDKTDATAGVNLYSCTATNTWTVVGTGAGGPPTGAAAGVLSGTYPNPGLSASATALPNGWTATTQTTGDGTTKVTTDAFVATALQSINPATNVQVSTTGVLPNTPTYANGTAGVGATLTAGSNTTLAAIDGYSVQLNDRILVKNQATTANNGCYTLTQVGSGSLPWILTRCIDYNGVTNINYTGFMCTIQTGSTYASDTCFSLDNLISAVGTSALTYTQQATGASAAKPGGGVQIIGNVTPGNALKVASGASGKNIQDAGVAFSALTQTIASGAKALATGAISSAACTSAQTDTATGTLTTDAIIATFNGDPTGVTGYVPLTTGMLTIIPYPTSGTVNFKVCNNTSASITPGAITINWRVVR